MKEKHVKGSMFIKIVIGIKADKTGAYDKYFSKEDRDFLSQKILSSGWYPYEIYKKCFNALSQVEGKGNRAVWKQWGIIQGEEMIKSVYQSVVAEKDPKRAMEKLRIFFKLMYDHGTLGIDFLSDNEMEFTYIDFDHDFEVSYIIAEGWITRILELCGCKDVKSNFITKSWLEPKDTKLHFTWT